MWPTVNNESITTRDTSDPQHPIILNMQPKATVLFLLICVLCPVWAAPTIVEQDNRNSIETTTPHTVERRATGQSATLPIDLKWNRSKRSGISDQRLAELEELLRIEMIRAAMKNTQPVAYGLFDPMKIGRRRKRNLRDDDYSESENGLYSSEAEDRELDRLVEMLLRQQNAAQRKQLRNRSRIQTAAMMVPHKPYKPYIAPFFQHGAAANFESTNSIENLLDKFN